MGKERKSDRRSHARRVRHGAIMLLSPFGPRSQFFTAQQGKVRIVPAARATSCVVHVFDESRFEKRVIGRRSRVHRAPYRF